MGHDVRDVTRSTTGDFTGFLSGALAYVSDDQSAYSGSKWAGEVGATAYTVGDIVTALKNIGVLTN